MADKNWIIAVRGAITADENTEEHIKSSTVELLQAMLEQNNITTGEIAFVNFTLTSDLDAAYPAKYAREALSFDEVPMLCYQEANIKNSLEKTIRAMMVLNSQVQNRKIKHIYLKGAKVLRPDIKQHE